MSVELNEGVVGSDHGQPWGGHSEVEAKADHYVRSKGPSVNGGKRKQIGSGRGSPRARARIALSCAALLGRRRRGESLLRHRMSARVLRMPARGVVADVTQNERIDRERPRFGRWRAQVRWTWPGYPGSAPQGSPVLLHCSAPLENTPPPTPSDPSRGRAPISRRPTNVDRQSRPNLRQTRPRWQAGSEPSDGLPSVTPTPGSQQKGRQAASPF